MLGRLVLQFSLLIAAPSVDVGYSDITAWSKVDFRHEASPTTNKYLIETMGGGVALLDYDNDGRLDIFFVNGAALRDPMPAASCLTSPIRNTGTASTGNSLTARSPI